MSATELIVDANKKFQDFKNAYQDNKFAECVKLLNELKMVFIKFPSFLPGADKNSATREKEVVLARQTLEYAVLMNSKEQKLEEFERNMCHLQSLYDDYSDVMPSERRKLITGLNLLRLLALNRTTEFHTQLELIPTEDHDDMYIRDVIQLERFLMEGSYHKLLQARSKVPSNEYIVFMNMLLDTVRTEVADCSARAYEKLSVQGAAKLLMFDSPKEAIEWAKSKDGWTLEGDFFVFDRQTEEEARAMPFHDIIMNNLAYAHEMERIV
jgi:26S proteasome regulatory subunit N12|eukprot:CAMPEP_0174287180 /NCGR_PEP_ID=MMETSP0809-20121228/14749_1 /TAXON_ID=73025 ORGANISM="Eutreptiella gymnastica-like, Strain CCMP1594" /NCGR_SAMPLE_ID=MMETSP0809 /ASSEMBLY_ACC=CAM_ASM_000658 /LENGTH=267 /DNA_ID=CAMNT_0015383585 /DNA_START=17 /DNA_END=820 /DNA_ORIENTATION=+